MNYFPIVYFNVERKDINIANNPKDIPEGEAIIVLETSSGSHGINDSLALAKKAFNLGAKNK